LAGGEEELESDAMDGNKNWGFYRENREEEKREYLLITPRCEKDKDAAGII
jgi:hypothetical protein